MENLNPATLTFQEYYKIANEHDKHHESNSYDLSLSRLNEYNDITKYPKLLRRIKVRGLSFEIRSTNETKGFDAGLAIFNDEKQKVATVQDEWGAMLIMVAREYRGFGFGPLLGKIARTLDPTKPSGGFTPAGYRNFVKVYREMVRDALQSGFYRDQVKAHKMTMERVKEIVASAHLQTRPTAPKGDYGANPRDYMLYVGGYGDFVLYDKKLKDRIEDDTTEDEYWVDRMVKGVVLVREFHGNGILVQFGGDTDKIKQFMMTCALSYCSKENIPFYVDPQDRQYVNPQIADVGKPDMKTGFKRYKVKLKSVPDMDAFGPLERRFRKSFDQYDEFKNRMLEIGFSKFRPD